MSRWPLTVGTARKRSQPPRVLDHHLRHAQAPPAWQPPLDSMTRGHRATNGTGQVGPKRKWSRPRQPMLEHDVPLELAVAGRHLFPDALAERT